MVEVVGFDRSTRYSKTTQLAVHSVEPLDQPGLDPALGRWVQTECKFVLKKYRYRVILLKQK